MEKKAKYLTVPQAAQETGKTEREVWQDVYRRVMLQISSFKVYSPPMTTWRGGREWSTSLFNVHTVKAQRSSRRGKQAKRRASKLTGPNAISVKTGRAFDPHACNLVPRPSITHGNSAIEGTDENSRFFSRSQFETRQDKISGCVNRGNDREYYDFAPALSSLYVMWQFFP